MTYSEIFELGFGRDLLCRIEEFNRIPPGQLEEFVRESYGVWLRTHHPDGVTASSSSGASSSSSRPTAVGVVVSSRSSIGPPSEDHEALARSLVGILDAPVTPNRDRGRRAGPRFETPTPRVPAPTPQFDGHRGLRLVTRPSPKTQASSGDSWIRRIDEDQTAEDRAAAAAVLLPTPPAVPGEPGPQDPVWITT